MFEISICMGFGFTKATLKQSPKPVDSEGQKSMRLLKAAECSQVRHTKPHLSKSPRYLDIQVAVAVRVVPPCSWPIAVSSP